MPLLPVSVLPRCWPLTVQETHNSCLRRPTTLQPVHLSFTQGRRFRPIQQGAPDYRLLQFRAKGLCHQFFPFWNRAGDSLIRLSGHIWRCPILRGNINNLPFSRSHTTIAPRVPVCSPLCWASIEHTHTPAEDWRRARLLSLRWMEEEVKTLMKELSLILPYIKEKKDDVDYLSNQDPVDPAWMNCFFPHHASLNRKYVNWALR